MNDQPRKRGRPRLPTPERELRATARKAKKAEQNRFRRQTDKDYADDLRNKNARRLASTRQNPDARKAELAARRARIALQSLEVQAQNRAKNTQYRASARKNYKVRKAELAARHARNALQSPEVQAQNRAKNTQAHAKAREDPAVVAREKETQLIRDANSAREKYEKVVRDGPFHMCNCCGVLFFQPSITTKIDFNFFPSKWDREFVDKHCPLEHRIVPNKVQLCSTCTNKLRDNKLPTFCFTTYKLPPIPDVLADLSPLEVRMISPRCPFMQIRKLSWDRQFGIKGNVVNVPLDVADSVNILPRNFDKMEIIQVRFKRRICDKNAYIYETIRPNKVVAALR